MSSPSICHISFGRNSSSFGIGQARPDISWRYSQTPQTAKNWKQSECEIRITREASCETHRIKTSNNICVPWPEDEVALCSKERARVDVRAYDGFLWTEWTTEHLEVSLLDRSDWGDAEFVAPDTAPPSRLTKRPFYARKTFNLSRAQLDSLRAGQVCRIYATALGCYKLEFNGEPIGDHVLAPGWQSYQYRLHFQTFDVPSELLRAGDNVIGVVVGEGWYSGRLMWTEGVRNCWGSEPSAMIRFDFGKDIPAVITNGSWQWTYGPILSSELYDGEQFDVALVDHGWSRGSGSSSWRCVKPLSPLSDTVNLVSPEAPPIRRVQEVLPVKLFTTPSGKKILDFGQNLVGWIKIRQLPAFQNPTENDRGVVHLKHFEWLERGEPNYAILRSAKATDTIFLASRGYENYEPSFTTHGFQFVEIQGWQGEIDLDNFVAVVVMSDMEKLGDFASSHKLINKLHENVVWGLKGNFVGVPTDCPQRDERLGYTGDLQVFATTANYLYNTNGFLSNWLHDLKEEAARNDSVPPVVAPDPNKKPQPERLAVWSDVIVLGPWELNRAFGNPLILHELYQAMCDWLDKGIRRDKNGLWDDRPPLFQLGDWLDPRAPSNNPALAMTDPYLVANAYLVHLTEVVAQIANLTGRADDAERYSKQHLDLSTAFRDNYITPSGRLVSDSQTAIVLAEQFGLLTSDQMDLSMERLARLVTDNKFKIGTGFAGTPGILLTLAKRDHLNLAYRMLQEGKCPSWLYPVTCGATTIWERWDSLKPDGSVNDAGMTSFNHYALGSVAHFLHSITGGISPGSPGYREIIIRPRPGGTLTWAKTDTLTPSGRVACSWEIVADMLRVKVEIPPNTIAKVTLPGQGAHTETVGSGFYSYTISWQKDPLWPPTEKTTTISSLESRLLTE